MKKIILLALTTLIMVGCVDERDRRDIRRVIPKFETFQMDSCEYVHSVFGLSHKGNCRFCKERRQKELKELVEQLKKINKL